MRAALCSWIPLLLWAVLGAVPTRADDAPWLPLRAGERWEYRVSRDHQYTPAHAAIDRVFSEGTLVRQITAREGDTFSVRETLSLQPQLRAARPEVESTVGRWARSDAGDLLLRRVESLDRNPPQESVYQPPLRWLPAAAESGVRWSVGTLRWDGTEHALTGEVLGREDVAEGETRYEDCLKVRYAGPVSGTAPIYTGPIPIRSGRTERIIWYERGVGVVRERITTEGEIAVPPDGTVARVSEIQTRRLVDHRRGE